MKKYFVLFVIALLNGAGTAQKSHWNIGVSSGVNISNLYGKDIENNSSKVGFNAGIWLEPQFNSSLALELGFYYSEKGTQWSDNQLIQELSLQYLQIPFLIKYYFWNSFSMAVGPYVGISLHENWKQNSSIQTLVPIVFPEIAPLDLGVEIKTQFYFTRRIYSTLQAEIGWMKVLENQGNGTDLNGSSHPKIYNLNFGINLGYQF